MRLHALPAANLRTGGDISRHRREVRFDVQRRQQQFGGSTLQRQVRPVAVLALQRDAVRKLRVERQADQVDVLRILQEVAGAAVLPGSDTDAATGLRRQRHVGRGRRGTAGAARIGRLQRRHQRHARVVVLVVRAEFGRAQPFREVAGGDTELAEAVRTIAHADAVDPDAGRAIEGTEAGGLRRGGQPGGRAGTRERVAHEIVIAAAEADHRAIAVIAGDVGGREVRAARVEQEVVEARLHIAFGGQRIGQFLRERQHRRRPERFAQLGTRRAQTQHIKRIGGVDAVLDERRLAPVDHLVADADVGGAVAERLAADAQERIEQFPVHLQAVTAAAAELLEFMGHLQIEELRAANEDADVVAVLQFQLVRGAEDLVDEVAGTVVQVAVVGIHRARRAAIGNTDQLVGAPLGTPQRAVGHGVVEVALDRAEFKLESGCRAGDHHGDGGGQRCHRRAPRERRACRRSSLHGMFGLHCLLLSHTRTVCRSDRVRQLAVVM